MSPAQSAASSSSSAVPSSSETGSPGSGMPVNLSGNSSLPFSFLITFIAIFLFFLGCGLGSRRVTRRLRRNLDLQITPLATSSSSRVREKPVLWDVCPSYYPLDAKSTVGADHLACRYAWENLTPLSSTYVRTPMPAGERSPGAQPDAVPRARFPWGSTTSIFPGRGMMRTLAATPALARPLPPHVAPPAPPRRPAQSQPEVRWRGHLLPQFIARPLLPPNMLRRDIGNVLEECVVEDKSPVQAIEVVVLISMPSPEGAKARRLASKATEADGLDSDDGKMSVDAEIEELEMVPEEGLGDYVLGFARAPWADELDGDEVKVEYAKGTS
ncbi:hypothetical protein C8Q79DRAFT_929850 [Trametes meyenii]|nr:hypothetical protein C8Q79DRAFT_929850 [Trametes meyenii]